MPRKPFHTSWHLKELLLSLLLVLGVGQQAYGNIMSSPAVFTALDKSDEGKISLKEGEYLGFTPDGRVIQNAPNGYDELFDNKNTYFIIAFLDKQKNQYRWNGKDYEDGQGHIFVVPDNPVTGKVAIWANSSNPDCYIWYKFIDVKDYTSKDFEEIKRRIENDKKEWTADYVYQASEDCIIKSKNEKEAGIKLPSLHSELSIKEQFANVGHSFGNNIEIIQSDKVYRINAQNQIEEVEHPLSDEQINKGIWDDDSQEYKLRFTTDLSGVKIQAFGISSKCIKNAQNILSRKYKHDVKINGVAISEHIRNKTNTLLKDNNVTDLNTPYNAETGTFADGDRILIDGSYGKIISDGISLTTHLLKTGEILSSTYLSSSKSSIHAPGLVTGSIEVVAQKVTDLTSLCTLAYDIATDQETRINLKEQFQDIKDEIGEDPKSFFPIFRDIVLTVTTGNTPEDWDKSINSKDSGERSHLITRGTGNAIVTLLSGTAIVKELPEIADKLGDAIKKVKRISQTLEDFIAKSLPEKLEDIENIWKTKYQVSDMLEGRNLFEEIMGVYRYRKADGWAHTSDISENFKGVDFYKGSKIDNQIYAEIAVSMKTTIITDVKTWLSSKPIQNNIRFLKEGLENADGMASNGHVMKITERAEVHIYMPKENITEELKKEWHNKLDAVCPKIKFEIYTLYDYIN